MVDRIGKLEEYLIQLYIRFVVIKVKKSISELELH